MNQVNRTVFALFFVHISAAVMLRWLAGIVTITVRRQELPFYPVFFAVVVSQICLIAIWIGSSHRSWTHRLALGLVGIAAPVSILMFEEWHNPIGFHPFVPQEPVYIWIVPIVLAVVTTTFVVSMLLVITKYHRLRHHEDPPPTLKTMNLQFSIRKTMMLTAVVAFLLALRQLVKQAEFDSFGSATGSMVMIVFVSFWFALTSLAAMWAAFGQEHPALRFGLVFSFSMIAGMIPTYFFETLFWEQVAWIAIMPIVAIVVFASLLAFRMVGYRLTAVPNQDGERPATLGTNCN